MNGGGLSIVYWRPSGLIVTSSHAERGAQRPEHRGNHHAERGKFVSLYQAQLRGSLNSSRSDLLLGGGVVCTR